jgi:hypothetical protein
VFARRMIAIEATKEFLISHSTYRPRRHECATG